MKRESAKKTSVAWMVWGYNHHLGWEVIYTTKENRSEAIVLAVMRNGLPRNAHYSLGVLRAPWFDDVDSYNKLSSKEKNAMVSGRCGNAIDNEVDAFDILMVCLSSVSGKKFHKTRSIVRYLE
jgi:hypothetical protein